MRNFIDAEHALVSALVLGHADPADLAGRLSLRDFYDPASGLLFGTVMEAASAGRDICPEALPGLLRAAGELHSDGYPIRPLLDWLPTLPVPAHPEAWGALVVANALCRSVEAAGIRMQQASNAYGDSVWGAGRVLAVAAGQRAAIHAGLRRWEELPASWRDAIPVRPTSVPGSGPESEPHRTFASRDEQLLEQELLAGLVEAPQLMSSIGWLEQRDFRDPACGQLYTALRQLHRDGRPIDLVTVAAALPTTDAVAGPVEVGQEASAVLRVCRALQPHRVFPATVPWLARQQIEASMLRQAETTGQTLVRYAASPAAVGGLGGPLLSQAVSELDRLGNEGKRLATARRTAPTSDDARDARSVSRLRTVEDVPRPDHRPDRGPDRGDGPSHLDRTAG
jgi:hypothetical protein